MVGGGKGIGGRAARLPSFPRKRESGNVRLVVGRSLSVPFWIPAYAGMTVGGGNDGKGGGRDGRGHRQPYYVIPSVAEESEMPDLIFRFLGYARNDIVGLTGFSRDSLWRPPPILQQVQDEWKRAAAPISSAGWAGKGRRPSCNDVQDERTGGRHPPLSGGRGGWFSCRWRSRCGFPGLGGYRGR